MNKELVETSFLYGGNANYIEQLYAQYEQDPTSLDKEWQDYFASLSDSKEVVLKNAKGPSWQRDNWPIQPSNIFIAAMDGNWAGVEEMLSKKIAKDAGGKMDAAQLNKAVQNSLKAHRLIEAYRRLGHLKAKIDPLAMKNTRGVHNQLELKNFGLSDQDLDAEIYLDGFFGFEKASLRKIIAILEAKYCGSIGIEYAHISDLEQRLWLQNIFEQSDISSEFDAQRKKNILQKIVEAEGFEQFLDAKYKGAKRFGLDGGESLIAGLNELVIAAAKNGVEEVVFGMAHRGRLNVLCNIMGKAHRAIFNEFMGGSYKPADIPGSGDVKYHLGASKDMQVDGKNLHMSLLPNPSHLEIVDPVVMGKARARQDMLLAELDAELSEAEIMEHRSRVLPILLHGDAAFSGQGIVQEVLAASSLKGYSVAGSLHVIINNQVGFTTDPECSRSTVYSSDVAKMIEAPVLHVNGDDTEAVVFAMQIALLYRQKFKKPVVVDMYCYRRYGHNEGDEPSFTQPLMYKKIRAHKSIVNVYSEKLIAQNVIDTAQKDKIVADWRSYLEAEFAAGETYKVEEADWLKGSWQGLKAGYMAKDGDSKPTAVAMDQLKQIGEWLVKLPEGFNLHKTIARFIDHRSKMLDSGEGLDWAMAEALAFGSLMLEGHPIRLSGEDVERGTFSQRHSVVYDQESKARYVMLNNIPNLKVKYEPVNSLLSEEGVLAYEYGYSLARPNALTLWEAQFGDFANGAQVVFDQFISSAESKWLRLSGLVCLLPHGFEGQGPEHSSARLERYLQLCAEDNMQVANCTTPANYFHILRRQIKQTFRKPLIIMTPKSLLRHKRAQSNMSDLSGDSCFKKILLDNAENASLKKDDKIRRVVLCSGKVYYDLYEEREKRAIDDVYLLRVEQLYPYPTAELKQALARFKNAEIYWCQEEPKNMGAWNYIEPYLEQTLLEIGAKYSRAKYVGRSAAASPAVGLASEHLKQLNAFLQDALT